GATLWVTSRRPLRNINAIRAGDVWCSTMRRGTSTEILIGGRNLTSIVLWSPNCHSKTAAPICSRSGSRLDIQNINLLSTLLVHAQYQYWKQLGVQFQEEMAALLERHVLKGLVDAPWVRTDDPLADAPLGRAVQRTGVVVVIPILSGLHHHYVR